MKSLSTIISEAATNVSALQNKQVQKNAQIKQNLGARYSFTNERKSIQHPLTGKPIRLKRIRNNADKTLGGWIESTSNLSQDSDSDAWVNEEAMVFDTARVSGNGLIGGFAVVFGNAEVQENAEIEGSKLGSCMIASGVYKGKAITKDKLVGISDDKVKLWLSTINPNLEDDEDIATKVKRLRAIKSGPIKYKLTDKRRTIQNPDFGVVEYDSWIRKGAKFVKDTASSIGATTKSHTKQKTITIHLIQRINKDGTEGDFGGWIESEDNLSQKDTCWVDKNAIVIGNAVISEDALILESAQVHGNAIVRGTAVIAGNASIFGFANLDQEFVSDRTEIAPDETGKGFIGKLAKAGKIAGAAAGAVAGTTVGTVKRLQDKGLLF